MSVSVRWLQLDHILGVGMWGNIGRIPFMQMDKQLTHKLKTAKSPQVHVVFNCIDLTGLPDYQVYRDSLFTYEDRLGWGVAYGNNSVTPYFINHFMTLHEKYFHLCTTFTDAVQFLMMADRKLAHKVDLRSIYAMTE